jgi:hypothetical protein
MNKFQGKIIIPRGVDVWPHELKTAQALVAVGHTVEFIKKSNREGEHSADIFLNGSKWEFKAPKSALMDCVERNLKKAVNQSDKIVFDSRRIKRIPDKAIMRELSHQLYKSAGISRIIFVNRHGIVIDIEPASK